MPRIYFQPIKAKTLFTLQNYAEVYSDEKLIYLVSGKITHDFKIRSPMGNTLCYEQIKKKWFMPMSASLYGLNGKELRTDCRINIQRRRWGAERNIMEMHLQITKRAYSNEYFTITHRDYWNKLEIESTDSKNDLYLAIWWCFNYWYRRGNQNS